MKPETKNKKRASCFTLHASGFSLLETTIAIAILVTAVVGPLTLASSSIKASSLAKNNLIAANLAQEGMELIKNHRDNNLLRGVEWIEDMGSPAAQTRCFSASGCQIDATTLVIDPCGASCDPLNLDTLSGLYSYGAGSLTIFTRKINIKSVNTDEIKVTSAVSWSERFGAQKFELETYMLNW